MTEHLIFGVSGYLLGSIPFGLVVGWAFTRIDVREFGSGKTGMTNVQRIAGWPAAVIVLLLDMGKAVLAVVLARITTDSQGAEAVAALAVLAGHNWPIFTGFKGGRGTAPGWGGLLILSPVSGLVATAIGLLAVVGSRYISLGSVSASTAGAALLVVLASTGHAPTPYIWFGAVGGPLVVLLHRDNIARIVKGTERKLGQSVDVTQGQSGAGRGRDTRWPESA